MERTYDCPVCDEPCSALDGLEYLDADAHDVLPGDPELEAVRFCCPLGHRFYVHKTDIAESEQGGDEE